MTPTGFRQLALACPGAVELEHMGHPDFRIGGKVFASVGMPDENWAMVKLTAEEQRSRVQTAPKVFSPCNGAWGMRGYTNVYLASATKVVVVPALESAAKNVAAPVNTRKA